MFISYSVWSKRIYHESQVYEKGSVLEILLCLTANYYILLWSKIFLLTCNTCWRFKCPWHIAIFEELHTIKWNTAGGGKMYWTDSNFIIRWFRVLAVAIFTFTVARKYSQRNGSTSIKFLKLNTLLNVWVKADNLWELSLLPWDCEDIFKIVWHEAK